MDRVEELRTLLTRANFAYYVKAEPFMTDFEYDVLLRKLKILVGKAEVPSWCPTKAVGNDLADSYPNWASLQQWTLPKPEQDSV